MSAWWNVPGGKFGGKRPWEKMLVSRIEQALAYMTCTCLPLCTFPLSVSRLLRHDYAMFV